jgi:hypothetical protein
LGRRGPSPRKALPPSLLIRPHSACIPKQRQEASSLRSQADRRDARWIHLGLVNARQGATFQMELTICATPTSGFTSASPGFLPELAQSKEFPLRASNGPEQTQQDPHTWTPIASASSLWCSTKSRLVGAASALSAHGCPGVGALDDAAQVKLSLEYPGRAIAL